MQRRKLGMAVFWMVCLLGMVAMVWSRPPLGGSRDSAHPKLALTAPEKAQTPDNTHSEIPFHATPLPQVLQSEPQAVAAPQPQFVLAETRALSGQWIREAKPHRVVFRFEGNRLHVELSTPTELGTMRLTASADYHITSDSIMYGVFTSTKVDFNQSNVEIQMTADLFARTLLDQPFAMRFRRDDEALTIKDFKMAQLIEDEETWSLLVQLLTSRFEPMQ